MPPLKQGMVQKRRFLGNTPDFSAYFDGPRVQAGSANRGFHAPASVPREPCASEKFKPVCVRLSGQQFRGTLVDSIGVFAAQVSAVVQEKMKQRQVVVA
jgi:hypothetical protein